MGGSGVGGDGPGTAVNEKGGSVGGGGCHGFIVEHFAYEWGIALQLPRVLTLSTEERRIEGARGHSRIFCDSNISNREFRRVPGKDLRRR